MDLLKLLELLPTANAAIARAPEFIALYEAVVEMLDPEDQETAKEALADVQADNNEGHDRYQSKLAEAAKR